jgi:hypothetical protein
MLLRLYFNEPPGNRRRNIGSVVTELQKKYNFRVEVIKKTDEMIFKRLLLPKFPALEIDEEIVFEGQDIPIDELERAMKKRLA